MARQEYVEKNRDWLRQKSTEPGVEAVDKTINGKTFDSSRGGTPPAFRLRDLISGWIIALQKMKVGEKCEIYIPAEQGYGRLSQPGIPGGSTLIFEIELIAVN